MSVIVPVKEPPVPPPSLAAVVNAGSTLQGRVAEVIQVPQYTYLRLETGEWAAIDSAPQLTVGQSVSLVLQNEMTDFSSPSLGRTFARLWFASLEGAAPTARRPPAAAATPEVQAALDAVASSEVLSFRVVDVFAERAALVGKRVKVQGTVDRVNFVQGIHYIHLKDGSGLPADKNNDLLCMSDVAVTAGQSVTMVGVVVVNKDVGMGPVPVVLDQARPLSKDLTK